MSDPVTTAPAPSAHFTPEMVRSYRRSRQARVRLTPEILARQLELFEAGQLRDFALTADSLPRRDDMIAVAWPKRCKAVARHGYAVQINDGLADGQKARAAEHQEAIKYCFDHCTATHALDLNERGGYRLLARQMMEALGVHFAVHELVWQPRVVEGKPRLTFTAHYVPLWFFENTSGRLRFLRNYWAVEGEDMAENEWLVTVGESLMEPLAVARCFKQGTLLDWVSFSEKFGMPGLLGKTSAAKDSPAWQAMAEAVEKFGQDWAAVCSSAETIELVEANGGAGTPFSDLVERMDRAIVSICRGGDLSSMSQQGESSGSNRQADESELLEEDDATIVEETLQQISRFVIRELFDEEPLAYLAIVVPRTKDTTDTVAKISALVSNGVPVGADWARGELGVPAPAKDEPLLKPAAPATPAVAAAGELPAANAAPAVDAGMAVFRRNSLRKLGEAESAAMQPVLDRIAALQALSGDQFAAALQALRADLPRLFAEARLQAPDIAGVWEQVLGTALVDGFSDAPSAKP